MVEWVPEKISRTSGISQEKWFKASFEYLSTQIERCRSNFRPGFFGAIAFKFEPKMTVVIKNLAQKVDFLTKCRSNQDCRSICAGTVANCLCESIFDQDHP